MKSKTKGKAENFKTLAEALDTATLVDEIGGVIAIMADFSKKKNALVAELFARAGNRQHIDGNLYTATIVAECLSSVLDVEAIKAEMGDEWVTSHSKDSVRKRSIRVTARKTDDQKKKGK